MKPSLYSHSNLGPVALESLQAPGQELSIRCSLFVISVLTCFGKVFPVITEIFEEGDTLTPRVVPPRCLQKHHLHTSSKPQTGMQRAGLGMGHLQGKVKPLIPTSLWIWLPSWLSGGPSHRQSYSGSPFTPPPCQPPRSQRSSAGQSGPPD